MTMSWTKLEVDYDKLDSATVKCHQQNPWYETGKGPIEIKTPIGAIGAEMNMNPFTKCFVRIIYFHQTSININPIVYATTTHCPSLQSSLIITDM